MKIGILSDTHDNLPKIEKAVKFFVENISSVDLVFVDGSAESRVSCIEASFGRTNVIVTHDTETSTHPGDIYKWNSLKKNENG